MMNLHVEHVDVWAASLDDTPGSLASVLTGLKEAGADLDFVIARRAPDKPGTGVVFVTPLTGDAQIAAAGELGFNVTNSLHSVRIEGDNKAGVGAEITGIIAEAGINLRGFSAAVSGERFIIYLAFDSAEDAGKALDTLKAA